MRLWLPLLAIAVGTVALPIPMEIRSFSTLRFPVSASANTNNAIATLPHRYHILAHRSFTEWEAAEKQRIIAMGAARPRDSGVPDVLSVIDMLKSNPYTSPSTPSLLATLDKRNTKYGALLRDASIVRNDAGADEGARLYAQVAATGLQPLTTLWQAIDLQQFGRRHPLRGMPPTVWALFESYGSPVIELIPARQQDLLSVVRLLDLDGPGFKAQFTDADGMVSAGGARLVDDAMRLLVVARRGVIRIVPTADQAPKLKHAEAARDKTWMQTLAEQRLAEPKEAPKAQQHPLQPGTKPVEASAGTKPVEALRQTEPQVTLEANTNSRTPADAQHLAAVRGSGANPVGLAEAPIDAEAVPAVAAPADPWKPADAQRLADLGTTKAVPAAAEAARTTLPPMVFHDDPAPWLTPKTPGRLSRAAAAVGRAIRRFFAAVRKVFVGDGKPNLRPEVKVV